jgi:hypothetical protein
MTFEYGTGTLKDLAIGTTVDKHGKKSVHNVLIKGEPVRPSQRFWTSLQMRFAFSGNIFKFFTHEEVFNRISSVATNDRVSWCIERGEDGKGTALAITNPKAALIKHDELNDLLSQYDAENVAYDNGCLRSTHRPRVSNSYAISGDEFQNRFTIATPIDGFGRPSVYLTLLRLICTNGAIGFSKTFRSELNVGRGDDGVHFALTRVLEGFNNEEGFAALRQRFESAANSWASVNEANRLYKTLIRLHHRKEVKGHSVLPTEGSDGAETAYRGLPVLRAFHQMTGDLSQMYGLANLDTLSIKRQRTLPAACKVYDLLNFASEVATHHATAQGNRSMQAFIGDLVSNEYDLEGTGDHMGDWRDFFINNKATADTVASMNSLFSR